MAKWIEFFEDSEKQASASRLCFIFGTFGLFALATAQFCGYGSIPLALYVTLGTMASGGYLGGKYIDSKDLTSLDTDEYVMDSAPEDK